MFWKPFFPIWKHTKKRLHKSSKYVLEYPQRWSVFTRFFSVAQPKPRSEDASQQSLQSLKDQYEAWKRNPSTVSFPWSSMFQQIQKWETQVAKDSFSPQQIFQYMIDYANHSMKISQMVNNYRNFGHFKAQWDPLKLDSQFGFYKHLIPQDRKQLLDWEYYKHSSKTTDALSIGHLPINESLESLFQHLESIYCGNVGYEYAHLSRDKERKWFQHKVERKFPSLSNEQKKQILKDLTAADSFERFLAIKFPTAKRYGGEGGESIVPGLHAILETASLLGVQSVVIGMPHRGRLAILANVLNMPVEEILHSFVADRVPFTDIYDCTGDVKSHLSISTDLKLSGTGNSIHVSLLENPSHLEVVNPVLIGKTKAKQDIVATNAKVLAVNIHGDAAFTGQGVVYETLQMFKLEHYSVKGTVHLIVNNQIGFTTHPQDGRSCTYCTDIAKALDIPVFHVNGDDPEAVVACCSLAVEYRQHFGKDVLIDLVCYRLHGHNEVDQPSFTQPTMYKCIRNQLPVSKKYASHLISNGVMNEEEYQQWIQDYQTAYQNAFQANWKPKPHFLQGNWKDMIPESILDTEPSTTGVSEDTLHRLLQKLCHVPENFELHPQISKLLEERRNILNGKALDWATAEALAFATLLDEGYGVRLSGQDCQRGTFSQRHALWVDQENEVHYYPFAAIGTCPSVYNSHLSENAVLGFEWGYSLESPQTLVIWEAQFGDFANSAQVMIDCFLSCSERKWRKQSGLVLFLPHGWEGQGPDHSSAKLERFLQLSDEDQDIIPEWYSNPIQQLQKTNIQVANCTSPANLFHLLRAQMHRKASPFIISFLLS
ncbi:2-oxoglutarate dehydrogenase E1 component [Galdieria sulphuraria]|uniref:2-oxoglutarate dehydrogenase E1 component n=1 Tax=Galdieria sulphuraria TaxID=130081 RepID=M2W796_GALSU|nr:2-oxoglutarate dehydrogenase E1 component [Galdieria sulphuraria]EME31691.1 2-oxoglutarate dehydrogenase E1 component [Galdieria sulphuraria]|eukprot:XP_005708211.1 2-oxoglutarate dehydrogenase E1 component [Galdieria sulphuraria]